MGVLNKSEIKRAAGLRRTKEIEVPPWDGSVVLRIVNAGELDYIESVLDAYRGNPMDVTGQVRARCAAMFLSDESGNRIFSDDEIAEIDTWPHAGLSIVMSEGLKFNKRSMRTEDRAKNSGATQPANSGTPSPSPSVDEQ